MSELPEVFHKLAIMAVPERIRGFALTDAQILEIADEACRVIAAMTRARAPSQVIATDAAAQWLMNWLDALADPFAVALAIAQAEEAYDRSLDMAGNEEAAKTARVRRFLESIAINNAKLIRSLTPPPADGGEG